MVRAHRGLGLRVHAGPVGLRDIEFEEVVEVIAVLGPRDAFVKAVGGLLRIASEEEDAVAAHHGLSSSLGPNDSI